MRVKAGRSRRRRNCALLARVVRAAGELAPPMAPPHSKYAYPNPKNPPQRNAAWIPAAEEALGVVSSSSSSSSRGNSRKNEVALETPNTPPRAGSLLPWPTGRGAMDAQPKIGGFGCFKGGLGV